MKDENLSKTSPREPSSSEAKSPLKTLLSRGTLTTDVAREFDSALRDKKEHAERAAEALAASWSALPKELQLIAIRWKWQGRKPESRAKACMVLGAAIAVSDESSASSLLSEAMKTLAVKVGGGTRPPDGASGNGGAVELRNILRASLIERWLRPVNSAALFHIRYIHLARESRSAFDSLLLDALGSLPSEFRSAVVDWVERQADDDPSAETRHALTALATRLRPSTGTAATTATQPMDHRPVGSDGRESDDRGTETTLSSHVSHETPQAQLSQATGTTSRSHPKVLIADAIRLIQSELKRWSAEDADELGRLRRKATDLEDSLKRLAHERDELVAALGNAKERCNTTERRLEEAVEQRNRAIASGERFERELQTTIQRAVEFERRCADAEGRSVRLDQELKQAREDKRKDVEYTRESERAATTKQISQSAKVHLENMHELLAATPSEKQRVALAACYEELFKVLTPSSGRSNG